MKQKHSDLGMDGMTKERYLLRCAKVLQQTYFVVSKLLQVHRASHE